MKQTSHLHRRFLTLVICFVLAFAFIVPAYPPSYARAEAYEEGEGEPEDMEAVPNPETPDQGSEPDKEEDPLPDTDPGEAEAVQETDEGEEKPDDPLPDTKLSEPESSDLEGDPEGIEEGKEAGEGEGKPENPPPEPTPPEKEALEPELSLEDPEEDEDPPTEIPARNFASASPLLFGAPSPMGAFPQSRGGAGSLEEGLVLDKTASYDAATNLVTIELEAYTTGEVHISQQAVPTEICLVLDQSGSMKEAFGSTTRQQALKTSVINFINKVEANASANGVIHRIGIVTFSGDADIQKPLSADYNDLRAYINSLPSNPSGATNTADGMAKAITVMNDAQTDHNKVVIMFTDGFPTTTSTFATSVADGAIANAKTLKDNQTTVYAVGIFNGADPSVMWGDNTHYPGEFNPYSNGSLNSKWRKTASLFGSVPEIVDYPAANRFMNLQSSNSASADSLGLERKTGGGGFLSRSWVEYEITHYYPNPLERTGYFLSANNPQALENIFQTIAQQIEVPAIELGPDTILLDKVADHFIAPAGGIQPSLYLADCTGVSGGAYTFGTRYTAPSSVVATVDGGTRQIQVTGFDFNQNFVADTPRVGSSPPDYGRKLIISFKVQPDPTFFGGNKVVTNKPESGVYLPNNPVPVGLFPLPDVDIPLNYQVQDDRVQKEYLGNPVDIGHGVVFKTTGDIPFQPDGINNAYVDISYRIYDSDGTTLLGTYQVPHGVGADNGFWDGISLVPPNDLNNYRVKVDVEPIHTGSYSGLNLNFAFTVYRYRPIIETWDETVYLGESVDLTPTGSVMHYAHVGWKCLNNPDATGIHGSEPDLDLVPAYLAGTDPGTYPGVWDSFYPLETSEFHVQVAWFNGDWPHQPQGVNISGACWYKRGSSVTHPHSGLKFWIYVKTCRITVEKAAASGTVIGTNESFMVDIEDAYGNIWRLRVRAGEAATLTGLPIGTYTVKEDRSWSWPYTPDPLSATVTLKPNAVEDHATVLVTNAKTIRRWITGETFVANLFKGLAGSGGGS